MHGIAAAGCQLSPPAISGRRQDARLPPGVISASLLDPDGPVDPRGRAQPAMECAGDHLDVASAKALRLVSRVVPPARLAAAAMDLAPDRGGGLTVAIRQGIRGPELGLADATSPPRRWLLAADAAEVDAFANARRSGRTRKHPAPAARVISRLRRRLAVEDCGVVAPGANGVIDLRSSLDLSGTISSTSRSAGF